MCMHRACALCSAFFTEFWHRIWSRKFQLITTNINSFAKCNAKRKRMATAINIFSRVHNLRLKIAINNNKCISTCIPQTIAYFTESFYVIYCTSDMNFSRNICRKWCWMQTNIRNHNFIIDFIYRPGKSEQWTHFYRATYATKNESFASENLSIRFRSSDVFYMGWNLSISGHKSTKMVHK